MKVKQLVFEEVHNRHGYSCVKADTQIGSFEMTWKPWKLSVFGRGNFTILFPWGIYEDVDLATLEEAKERCQKRFEECVSGCIEPEN